MNDIAIQVKLIITEMLGIEESRLSLNASFSKDLGVDSLDVFELFGAIEKKMDILIPDEQGEKILTVGQLIHFISQVKS